MRVAVLVFAVMSAAKGHEVTVDWSALLGSNPDKQNMSVEAGAMLKFNWNGYHNVYQMASKEKFDKCDFSGAQEVIPATASQRMVGPLTTAGSYYYACQVNMHCSMGQKIEVLVKPSHTTGTGYNSGAGSMHSTGGSGLCAANGVTIIPHQRDSGAQQICKSTNTECEVYMKKDATANTCQKFCENHRMQCIATYDDDGDTCSHQFANMARGGARSCCYEGHTSDHICACGVQTAGSATTCPPVVGCQDDDDGLNWESKEQLSTCANHAMYCQDDSPVVAMGAPKGWFKVMCPKTCGCSMADRCCRDYYEQQQQNAYASGTTGTTGTPSNPYASGSAQGSSCSYTAAYDACKQAPGPSGYRCNTDWTTAGVCAECGLREMRLQAELDRLKKQQAYGRL
jgi:plastocyanin